MHNDTAPSRGELVSGSNEDEDERPTKKIRLQDHGMFKDKKDKNHHDNRNVDNGCDENDANNSHARSRIKHHAGESPSVSLKSFANSSQKTDAETFLFRSPASSSEIEQIAAKIKSQIDTAHEQISKFGFQAYRKSRKRSMTQSQPFSNIEIAGEDIRSNNDDEKGVDTDDEVILGKKTIEKAAALEEAVIRGNPRRYQTALFELAKKQNTIVHLGTGQGKTLIALLLIKHFAQLDGGDAFRNGTKQTLFLVPSVALVTQHSCTLQANLPYSVATACHNTTLANGTREQMAKANILVATHGAARDLFMHYGDIFSFDRINLLIMDECHYTAGEHGYATIMRNFYHKLPRKLRPRVLGLTASPLVNIKRDLDDERLGQLLGELEQRLDSRLASLSKVLRQEDDKIDGHNNSNATGYNPTEAEERCIHYHRATDLAPLPSHEGIGLHEGRVKEFNQFIDLYNDMGPKVTSIYSATVAREISINRYEEETKEQFAIAIKHLKNISVYCEEQCKNTGGGRTEKLAVLEELLEDIIESKGAKNTVGVVFVERRITALALYDYFRNRSEGIANGTWLRVKDTKFRRKITTDTSRLTFAPKMIRDNKKRLDLSSMAFQDMNFSAEELEAEILNDVLVDALPKGYDMKALLDIEPSPIEPSQYDISVNVERGEKHRTIRCDMIVRQCTSVFKYLDRNHHFSNDQNDDNWLHKLKRVKDVLDGLRTKRTNVLIATSVVEEGIDVDACSFVIVLDSIRSTKGYIQMKGRARQKNARFFVFQDTSPSAAMNPNLHLEAAQTADLRVKKFIESRSEYLPNICYPVIRLKHYDGDSIFAEQEAAERGEYRTKIGLVDLSSAKPLLNRYTLSIPLETSSRSTRDMLGIHLPQFEENNLILPAHIPSTARCVTLPEKFMSRSKRDKQCILSLMACVRLHKLNLLNDRLLPLRRKDMQNKLLSVALTELFTAGECPEQKSPPMHEDSSPVYIYKLAQSGKLFKQNDEVLCGDGRSLCLVSPVPLGLDNLSISFHHVELGQISVSITNQLQKKFNSFEWDCCSKFHTILMNMRWRRRTGSSFYVYNIEKVKKGILPPYVIGCLTKDDNIDWDRLKSVVDDYNRTEEERIKAVRVSSSSKSLETPRIWSTLYDQHVSYISYGASSLDCGAPFSQQDEEIKSYGDYFTKKREFKVSDSTKLFEVQRHWHLPQTMLQNTAVFDDCKKKFTTDLDRDQSVLQNVGCEGLVAALLPMDACLEAPIADAALMLHSLVLPQVLYHMDRVMTAQLYVQHCSEYLPVLGSHLRSISKDSFDDVLEALTAKSCGLPDFNYDRLEWLGDAVLKLIHTDALLHSKDLRKWVSYLHEGDLSVLRSAMGSNMRLMQASKAAGFDRFILFRQLGRSHWVPSGLELHEVKDDGVEQLAEVESEEPGKKTKADIIESVLGLIYFKIGFQAAYDVATELGITLPRDPDYDVSISGYKQSKTMIHVADKILGGIDFQHPELLQEALTHPSCMHEDVPCYQRLEWVGDAVLCLFTRQWLFRRYSDMKVGELVILEATVVCNETLAYLSVSNGLQRYLNHRDIKLPGKFEEFERMCNDRGLWATDPPKCLSDIVEALLGAVFVDSGLVAATASVETMFKPILKALSTAMSGGIGGGDLKSKARTMVHPKQYVHELGGGIMSVKSWREEILAIKQFCPVWKDGGFWGEADRDGSNHIGVIESFGIDLIGIEERSSHVARNRACAIIMEVFERNPELLESLKRFGTLIQEENVGEKGMYH